MDVIAELKPNSSLPLQAFELSLEIYLLINEVDSLSLTVQQIREIIFKTYGDKVRTKRIKQVCDHLADRGRILKIVQPDPRTNNPITTYRKNDEKEGILIGSGLWDIAITLKRIR